MEFHETSQNSTSLIPNTSIPNISSTYTTPINSEPSGLSSNPLDYTNTIPDTNSNRMFMNDSSRTNVLSRYPWIDSKLIDDIAFDIFNITSFPKLYHDKEFRNQYMMKTIIEGDVIQYFLDKSKSIEILLDHFKLYHIFIYSNSFLNT